MPHHPTLDIGVSRTFKDGEDLLQAALKHVESDSIRDWASGEHNRPILVQIAQGVLDKNGSTYSDLRFANLDGVPSYGNVTSTPCASGNTWYAGVGAMPSKKGIVSS